MSTLSAKDRVSLCMFSFADGRRCRTPRVRNNAHFCFYHAQKGARAQAAETLGKYLAFFFSGDYLSACDLSTALGRLIPAVVRGDVKPRTARTIAYLAQTLMQSIHISQHEYCEAFSPDTWRKSIRTSVNSNHNYRFPFTPSKAEAPHYSGGLKADVALQPTQTQQPTPQPQVQSQSAPLTKPPQPTPQQSAPRPESASSSNSSLACPPRRATHHSFTPSATEGPLSHPLPPTGAEFARQVLATRNLSQPDHARSVRPAETGKGPAPQATPPPAQSQPPASTPPASTLSPGAPPSPVCHPEPACAVRRSEGSHPHAAATTNQPQPTPTTQPPQPACPEQGRTDKPPRPTPQPTHNWQTGELHFDHTCRLRIDGKPI
jgi:hypothetical protein